MAAVAQHRDHRVARPQPPRRFDRSHAVHRRAAAHKQPLVAQQVLRLQQGGAGGGCAEAKWVLRRAGKREAECEGCIQAGSALPHQQSATRWMLSSRPSTRASGQSQRRNAWAQLEVRLAVVRSTHHLNCLAVAALEGRVHPGPFKVAGQPVDANALCSNRQTGKQGGTSAHRGRARQPSWHARLHMGKAQAASRSGASSQQASRLPSHSTASTHQ